MAFITIKRKTVAVILALILAVVAVAATAASVIASARAENGVTIVIDPGHGGADGGVVGVSTGTKESDVNLSISKYLADYFKKSGYTVVLTRTDMGSVEGGIKYSKRGDMAARRNVVEKASPDLVISVHCNSFPRSSVSGAQVFYAQSATLGKQFADTVQGYFNEVLNKKPRSAAVGDYYILNCTEYPSILCECGFLSNFDDEKNLITASYQEKVAYTIFSAVNSVFYDKA
ncbi:MAG: N-acetylmuramoyl-L-alanine amidase [Clostridiales bacterium]|nr:N-acetylmuramoyl-L-alanine amidase [Clostridiales bacterium]